MHGGGNPGRNREGACQPAGFLPLTLGLLTLRFLPPKGWFSAKGKITPAGGLGEEDGGWSCYFNVCFPIQVSRAKPGGRPKAGPLVF